MLAREAWDWGGLRSKKQLGKLKPALSAHPPHWDRDFPRLEGGKKKTWEDMFNKLLLEARVDKMELRTWRITLSENLDMDREDRRACREQECAMQEEMLWIMKEQSDTLRRLVEVQERQLDARVPLQSMLNMLPSSPSSTSFSPKCPMRQTAGGGKFCIPCTQHQGRIQGPEGAHSHTFDCYCSASVSKLSLFPPHSVISPFAPHYLTFLYCLCVFVSIIKLNGLRRKGSLFTVVGGGGVYRGEYAMKGTVW
ncbi:uncharacterized protein LOC120405868 [Mauremys reevesii]|uniref:uncharacterized protein LOC120405868 n=1 Tax=Mauremys reevesii TaxID=260615 RepID=UPI00193F05EC|nr:uncharacterized protein LOC120405868 [Mauremys reevesii]